MTSNTDTNYQPAGPSGPAGSPAFMTRGRKALISLLVLGALAAVGAGTFASFTAQTNNANNTFQTGTITLSNTVATGTACWSTGTANGQGTFTNGNLNTGCDVVGNVTNAKPAPASTFSSNVVNVATAGSLTPSAVTLAVTCASTDVASSANGNGNLCAYLGLTIQQCATYTSGGNCATLPGSGVAGGAGSCVFPASATNNCAANPTLAGGTLADAAALVSPINLASGALTASYQVRWNLPDSGVAGQENPVQGRIATWALKFTAVQ